MASDNDVEKLLINVERFFRQESELFGDEAFISNRQPAVSSQQKNEREGDQVKSQTNFQPPTESVMTKPKTTKQESRLRAETPHVGVQARTIKVSEDHGLFDGAVLKKEWKIDPHWYESDSLQALDARISKCMKCPIGSTRKNFVFGVGNRNAKLVLIGEAPGADEDEQGEPFVGRAGQLLNKILAAVQLRREDVYICNILKCRPPNNRDPLPEEVDACEPFLKKQLEIIKPKIIMCLGRIAGQTLLKTNATLSELRNNIYVYQGIKVLVTFHPAALLRNPNWKRPAWEDVQKMRRMYDEI